MLPIDATNKLLKLNTAQMRAAFSRRVLLALTLSLLFLPVVMDGEPQAEQHNQHCLEYLQARVGRVYAEEQCK